MSTQRSHLPSFELGRHLYAVGGFIRGGSVRQSTVASSVERYDTEASTWSPMATERYGTSSVVVGEADGGVEVDLFESLTSKFKALHARR